MDLQAKLLRAIQEGEIERVGGTHPIKTSFRLIAATNVDLDKAVRESRFREDLYFRLNIIPIRMPALRDRIEDLPELANFFLRRYNVSFRRNVQGIAESTLKILSAHWWPGNIRELENLIARLVAVTEKDWITDEDLPYDFLVNPGASPAPTGGNVFDQAVDAFARNYLIRALETNGWNTTATAKALGMPLSTLKFKMTKLEVQEIKRFIRGGAAPARRRAPTGTKETRRESRRRVKGGYRRRLIAAARVEPGRTIAGLLLGKNGVLQLLGDARLHHRLGRDLDGLAGGRVATHARLALLDHELHHARQHELAGPLQLFLRERGQLVEVLACLRALHFEAIGKMREQLGFAHASGLCHCVPPIPDARNRQPVAVKRASHCRGKPKKNGPHAIVRPITCQRIGAGKPVKIAPKC